MNDPFAFLNPIEKSKTAPAYGGPPAAPVAPLHPIGPGGFGGPGAAHGMGMNMNMAPMGMGMGMGGGMPGGMGMGMGGMPGMGGMGMGMGGGMGMGQPQQQQSVQAPIMYDNIKNLLQQKPKPAGAMRDDTSMDFLENLGSGKSNSVSVTSPTAAVASPFAPAVDPFGGSAPTAPASIAVPVVSLTGFEFPGESSSGSSAVKTTVVSPSGGAKSSALADRLANGRRKTQEAQRQQLGFNVGAFSQSSGAPKISLKELAPSSAGSSSNASTSGDSDTHAPSLEDFASGKPVFHESEPFGMPSSSSSGGSNRTNSGSSGRSKQPNHFGAPASSTSVFDSDGGVILADSDADFDSKLNGGANSGSSRHLSSGNLSGSRTGSGSAAAKQATMDFGW